MLLHLHEWGDRASPPVVCLHGVSAHGRRFRRLAEERLARRFRVLAPDLRGHGRSGWEPPWTIAAHVADVLETIAAAGVGRAAWIGHSFGGRLVLELAAREPHVVERAALLDPAIQFLPHIALDLAEHERNDASYATAEEAIEVRLATRARTPREFLEEEMREHLVAGADGRLRHRYCRSAVIAGYSEMCSEPPPPDTLRVPAMLVHAPEFGLVREEHLDAYASRADILAVTGGHVVYWDAYEETAYALEEFLGGID
ncbi:MAG TPA: alpha/beta hydrolase [Gaiellaceae bacterium]